VDRTEGSDKRVSPRSNIFVIATLYEAGGSAPVRVRNMSLNGALVEAAALPPAGSLVRLCRGSLSIMGEVVWVGGGKAGLHFSSAISVGDWLPAGQRGAGQQMADELVHQARLGAIPAVRERVDPEPPPRPASKDLLRLSAELEQVGEDLAADADVAVRHASALQAIDGIVQTLARLAADDGGAPLTASAAP
jgi:hypothetical protein